MNESRVEGAVRSGSSKMQQSVSSLTGVAQSRTRRAAKQRSGERPPNERETGRWMAQDDDSRRYTVVERQLVTVRRDAKGNTFEVLGPVCLALESGQDVRPLANGSYEIFADGRIIRRMR